MFMWVSSVALRAVSSGSAVIAVLRWAAFADRSLRPYQLSPRRPQDEESIHLSDIIHVTNTSGPRDLSGILLVPVQLCVNVFRDLWEGVCGILCPEEILGVEVV